MIQKAVLVWLSFFLSCRLFCYTACSDDIWFFPKKPVINNVNIFMILDVFDFPFMGFRIF